MKKILVLAIGGAGGDLQPLIAAVLGLRQRGHQLSFLGDATVANTLEPLGFETVVFPPEHDLGPRIVAAVRDSQGLAEAARGAFVDQQLSNWAKELARIVQGHIRTYSPDLLLTSRGRAAKKPAAAEPRRSWGGDESPVVWRAHGAGTMGQRSAGRCRAC